MIDRLIETLVTGGPVMLPIFGSAVFALYLILKKHAMLRVQFWFSVYGIRQMQDTISDYPDLFLEKYSKERGMYPAMLRCIRENMTLGPDALKNHLREVWLASIPKLEKGFSTIQVLANITPLLGLLGTVLGMIHTFKVIAVYGSGNPVLLADGISEALITTQAGLVVAFPVLLLYNYIYSKRENYLNEIKKSIIELLNHLFKKHGADKTWMRIF
ncbi:MAG: MotA/TolQ/ExbB proton channel family protein [bacterium]